MSTIELDKILTKEDCELERTPQQLIAWFEEKNGLFSQTKEGKKYALLHKGLAKAFFEEIYPLSLFAKHRYNCRTDVGCKPNLGNENFDAHVIDYAKNPPQQYKIEFTQAVDGYEDYLRMVYFTEHGHANALGNVTVEGTKKTGHKIEVENEVVEHKEIVKRGLKLITDAARQKAKKSYGEDMSLVITFDDYSAFWASEELYLLKDHTQTEILPMKLDFSCLYLMGLSGNSLLKFPLRGSSSTIV